MEVDTGAAVSIISEKALNQILPQAKLQPSRITLRTYTEERMKVRGELSVDVTYRQQHKEGYYLLSSKTTDAERRNTEILQAKTCTICHQSSH